MVEDSVMRLTNMRNPRRNDNGTIDLELDHPVHGTIPFTASPDDPETHGRELYERAEKEDFGPVAAPDKGSA